MIETDRVETGPPGPGSDEIEPIPAARDPERPPLHPGEVVAEVMIACGRSETESHACSASRAGYLRGVTAGRRPVTPQMAVRFGKLFGNCPSLWAKMQLTHDLWHAVRATDVSDSPTIR